MTHKKVCIPLKKLNDSVNRGQNVARRFRNKGRELNNKAQKVMK